MVKSPHLLQESAIFRIEWWPSPLCERMLWALALLAPFALWASDLPRAVALLMAPAALAWGVRDARRYAAGQGAVLQIPLGQAPVICAGQPVEQLQVRWRGPLVFMHWQDAGGRTQRCVFFPDTLDADTRRELRLALMQRETRPDALSVAR